MSASDVATSVLPGIQADIHKHLDILKAATTPQPDLVSQYDALTARVNEIQMHVADDTLITIGPKISSLQSDLTTLNDQVKRVTRKGGGGFIGDIYTEIQSINAALFIETSTLVGMLFGGIVASNWHVGNKASKPAVPTSIPAQLMVVYYFVYGAALFPLALLYGALWDTPAWRSTIIPLFEVPTGLFVPLVSYRPRTDITSYTAGKTLLRLACYFLLACLGLTIYLINFNA
jgi:hypothetical protein